MRVFHAALYVILSMGLPTIANAQNLPAESSRPTLKINLETLMAAASSETSAQLVRLIEQIRRHPNAKSDDFHSFQFTDEALTGWLWPRQCVSFDELKQKTAGFIDQPMYEEPSLRSPQTVTRFRQATTACILSITVQINKSPGDWWVFYTDKGQSISFEQVLNLLSEDRAVSKSEVGNLRNGNRNAPRANRTTYPVSWLRSAKGEYGSQVMQVRFADNGRCVKTSDLEAQGFTLRSDSWFGNVVTKKDSRIAVLGSFAVDPKRPGCISALEVGR